MRLNYFQRIWNACVMKRKTSWGFVFRNDLDCGIIVSATG